MEFISDLSAFLVSITIIVGLPIGVVWLIVAVVKKSNKKIPRNILLGCCASISVFTLIGSGAWSQTEEGHISLSQKNENTEKETEIQTETQQEIVSKDEQETQQETNTESEIEMNSEENPIDEGDTEVETETVAELTEEEYKAMCQEVYNDDVFKGGDLTGELVKIQGFISSKGTYTATSTFGIMIEEIAQKYDLDKMYLCSCVMHEETKNDAIPSYFGESVYLLFNKEYPLSIDDYNEGQKILIYGEVVKWLDNKRSTYNSVWIIPKYIEFE